MTGVTVPGFRLFLCAQGCTIIPKAMVMNEITHLFQKIFLMMSKSSVWIVICKYPLGLVSVNGQLDNMLILGRALSCVSFFAHA